MEKTKPIVLDPLRVPEVMAFLEAEERLAALKREYRPVFDEFRVLVEQRNAALIAADKVLRPNHASCGPFKCRHIATKYDAVALYLELGEEQFKRLGGSIRQTVEYELDRDRFEALIDQVPPDVLERVQKSSPAYDNPKPAVLP
ncbi:hypothetical protein LVJ94_34990 [Pendulispora rubella]|uniref:Uncharacterized protein n=1 Tax=Pendulispora rubella TaxID=2741070 RepID=A0ABZ2KTV7_9BACT